jgi:hypothetical protein
MVRHGLASAPIHEQQGHGALHRSGKAQPLAHQHSDAQIPGCPVSSEEQTGDDQPPAGDRFVTVTEFAAFADYTATYIRQLQREGSLPREVPAE